MARATILVVAIVALLCIESSFATQYEVGDSQGWDSSTDFKTWASYVFRCPVFKYTSAHSLAEVNKAGYDVCSTANAVASYNDGQTTIALSKAGKRYFVCGTPSHCAGGMKLEVDSLAATAPASTPSLTPSEAPSTIPASSSPESAPVASATPKTSPSSSHTPTNSPPSESGATSTSFGVGFVALAATTIVAFNLL